MTIYAGKLKNRVIVEKRSETQDATSGELVVEWISTGPFWALVEPLDGSEGMVAGQLTPETTHRVTMRYGISVTTQDRIRWGDRYFEIMATMNVEERGRELILSCKEIVP